MKILPAIDLKDGRCVRLCQGRADDATIYSDSPTEMALKWQSLGAEFLHLVDLTGAFEGHPAHTEVIRDIAKHISIPFEVGGGLRTDADVQELLDAGILILDACIVAIIEQLVESINEVHKAYHFFIAYGNVTRSFVSHMYIVSLLN